MGQFLDLISNIQIASVVNQREQNEVDAFSCVNKSSKNISHQVHIKNT